MSAADRAIRYKSSAQPQRTNPHLWAFLYYPSRSKQTVCYFCNYKISNHLPATKLKDNLIAIANFKPLTYLLQISIRLQDGIFWGMFISGVLYYLDIFLRDWLISTRFVGEARSTYPSAQHQRRRLQILFVTYRILLARH